MERVDELRQSLNMLQVVGYYYDIPRNRMIHCPFHRDKTPSFYVYDDHAFCFGSCRRGYDMFRFVMAVEGVSFARAVERLEQILDERGDCPIYLSPIVLDAYANYTPPPAEYQVYWQSLLTPDRRVWLNERLIDDVTIDFLGLGYRPDIEAYSIPFWGGVPHVTPVEVFQFRSTPLTPLAEDGVGWKYKGLHGHNRPALINQFVINPSFVVMFFGTLDAVLALQDGLPAISPNGAGVFGRRLSVLKGKLGDVRHLYIVPDNTDGEYEFAERYAEALGGHVALFPLEHHKDYTDWRLAGRSVDEFIHGVLRIGGEMFVSGDDRKIVEELAQSIIGGDFILAGEYIAELEQRYATGVINHALQLVIWRYASPAIGADLTARLLDALAEAGDNQQRFWQIVREWCDYLSSNNPEAF